MDVNVSLVPEKLKLSKITFLSGSLTLPNKIIDRRMHYVLKDGSIGSCCSYYNHIDAERLYHWLKTEHPIWPRAICVLYSQPNTFREKEHWFYLMSSLERFIDENTEYDLDRVMYV